MKLKSVGFKKRCKMSWNEFCQRWRLWIKPLLLVLYILFALIVVPLLIVNSVKDGFSRKDQLVLIGGLFVLSAVPISIWHIIQHLVHLTKPILQKHIVRILWMVPIYALNAWLGLLFPDKSIYLDIFRECYEAYVIYNFMKYLLNFLNLEMDLEATLETKPPVQHGFPLCCMEMTWEMGREFVHNCKHGILQYTVVRPITSFIAVICELSDVYGEGSFKGDAAYPYIIAINNISQFIAMYCLVLFYRATRVELKPMNPLPKFLCIKAVVFFSFFQGVAINILVYYGYIKNIFGSQETDDYKNLSSKLQNFLICIEMFIAAIAHQYSFPHYPFHINIPNYGFEFGWYNAFSAMLDISDVHQDVSEHLGVVGSTLSRRLRGRNSYHMTRGRTSSEGDHLIPVGNASSSATSESCYQSGISNPPAASLTNTMVGSNRYGALDGVHGTQADSIQIVKQSMDGNPSSYLVGAPKEKSVFNFGTSPSAFGASWSDGAFMRATSSGGDNTTSKSDSTSTAAQQRMAAMKKSDSSASDWLSTPTDEILGIDVRGIEEDRINYKPAANT